MYSYFTNGNLNTNGDSITEGIGQSRITGNLKDLKLDFAFQVKDEEVLPICFSLLKKEGLHLGGSSGVNVAGAIKLAKKIGPGKIIVTILCDIGSRYNSKIFNPNYLISKNLPFPSWLDKNL